jgi:hypothetical protein
MLKSSREYPQITQVSQIRQNDVDQRMRSGTLSHFLTGWCASNLCNLRNLWITFS